MFAVLVGHEVENVHAYVFILFLSRRLQCDVIRKVTNRTYDLRVRREQKTIRTKVTAF